MSGARAFLRELHDSPHSASGTSAKINVEESSQAYERGVADGLEQAAAKAAAGIQDAIGSLAKQLGDATALRATLAREAEAEAAAALSSVVRKLCPDLGSVRIAEHAAQMLETYLIAAPRPLIIRAEPEVAARLTELLKGRLNDDIRIENSDRLSGSQVGIHWHEGRAVIDSGALADRILTNMAGVEPDSGDNEEDFSDE